MSEDNINWYHGKLSREKAEQLLRDEGTGDGTFLVRECSTAASDYVLSVLCNDQIVHYQIRRHGDDAFFSIDEENTIHGLETLIEYYKKDCHRLVSRLIHACKFDLPPPDSRRHGSTNLLHRATKEGHYILVSELMKDTCRSLEAKNQEGQTAVHLASQIGKDRILKKLIDSGANINCRDSAGYTPLHYACQSNLPNTVQLLISHGANVQARHSDTGWVPLHEAASRGWYEVVRVLLAFDAPVRPRTIDNETPEDLAIIGNHAECVKTLKDYERPQAKSIKEKWYHGTLDRNEATALLKDKPDGTFLIRYSDRNGGAHVLTMICEGKLFNFIIRKQNEFLFIDNGPYLESLEHIVDFYSCMADGLPTTLQHPLSPQPKPPLPEFSTMPRPSKHNTVKTSQLSNVPKESSPVSTHKTPCFSQTLPLIPQSKSDPLFYGNIFSMSPPTKRPLPINAINLLPSLNNNVDNNWDQITIPREYIYLKEMIGEGEFGNVYRALYSEPQRVTQEVAVKTLHSEHAKNDRDSFLKEIKIMMQLSHHCIIKLIGVCYADTFMMIQEYAECGSLLQYLLDFADRISPDYELKIWAAQIACGMKYLEEQRFVHRDLAARNILLASRNQAKISDFGLSRMLNTEKEYYMAQQGGKWPLKWYAPESYNLGKFSSASDVWSFGVLLWEMFSFGLQPFGDRKGAEVIQAIDDGERLVQPSKCPDNVYEIMLQCWDFNPQKRPTFVHLLDVFSSDPDYINIKELVVDRDII